MEEDYIITDNNIMPQQIAQTQLIIWVSIIVYLKSPMY